MCRGSVADDVFFLSKLVNQHARIFQCKQILFSVLKFERKSLNNLAFQILFEIPDRNFRQT